MEFGCIGTGGVENNKDRPSEYSVNEYEQESACWCEYLVLLGYRLTFDLPTKKCYPDLTRSSYSDHTFLQRFLSDLDRSLINPVWILEDLL